MAITREEYEKLVRSAPSFQAMPPDVQTRILAAEGEQMQKYVEMFEEEAAVLHAAVEDFNSVSEGAVIAAKSVVRKEKKQKIQTAEHRDQAEKEAALENLIKTINN